MKIILYILLIISFFFLYIALLKKIILLIKTQILSNFKKGVEAVKNKEYALAADIFEELAISGDMDAQFNYAILVRNGLGRAQNYSEALYWTWLSYASGLEKADKVLEKNNRVSS